MKNNSWWRIFYRISSILMTEVLDYADALISNLPGASGRKLRKVILRMRLGYLGHTPMFSVGTHMVGASSIYIGNNFSCGRNCTFYGDGNGRILIGDRVSINSNSSLNASIEGEIKIGSNVLIGPSVLMRATDHQFSRTDIPISCQGHRAGKILIADDVWIGGNVTIVGGAIIGEGAVVAAGAVVTSEVFPYSVVGGVPARFIKWRKPPSAESDLSKL